jgi:CheY-like chemotaxis protein
MGGLGLGLAIARLLIAGHDGTIEARSGGPKKGTYILVRLPLARTASTHAVPQSKAASEKPSKAPRRVLVVDDNPDAATLLADAMSIAGHDVRTAGDGPSALELVESYVPEIAFLDIGLPVMDGYELASLLRQVPGLARTPFIAITGYAQDGDRKQALASGFVEHLAKPVNLADVMACVERFSSAERTRD